MSCLNLLLITAQYWQGGKSASPHSQQLFKVSDMKSYLGYVMILMVTSLASCKRAGYSESLVDEIPDDVEAAFRERSPEATEVRWVKEDKYFVVEFNDAAGKPQEHLYTLDGEYYANEINIPLDNIMPIQNYIRENMPHYRIEEAEKVVKSDESFYYEVQVSRDGQERELLFDPTGNFLKQDLEKDKGDDSLR